MLFESTWSPAEPAWVADHRWGAQVVVPASAFAELARAAGESLHGAGGGVRSLLLEQALILTGEEPRRVQVLAAGGGLTLGIYSRPARDGDSSWTLHARAELERPAPRDPLPSAPEPPRR